MHPWKPCSWCHGQPRTSHFLMPISHHQFYTAVELRYRNLMPSLRPRHAVGIGVFCSQDNMLQGVHWPWVVNALYAWWSIWWHVQSTLHVMICVYGRADPAVLIIRIRLIFGSTIQPNTNSAFFRYLVPNRIRIEYLAQPYFPLHLIEWNKWHSIWLLLTSLIVAAPCIAFMSVVAPIVNLKGHYFQPSLSVCVSLTGTFTLQR